MPYRSDLEARIAKRATQAITDFGLIEEGDRILVALSGGKDSWALYQILDQLRRRAPFPFSLSAVVVDAGLPGYRHDVIAAACDRRGWPCRVVTTRIAETIDRLIDAAETPCALCSRLRRGVLYRIASEAGATKIALGHHADDGLETLLLNLLFAGSLKAMPARLTSEVGGHVVIRPLVFVSEADTGAYARACGFPIVECACRACGSLAMQRQRIKRLVADLDQAYPGARASMLRALRNVAPSHLLDSRWTSAPRGEAAPGGGRRRSRETAGGGGRPERACPSGGPLGSPSDTRSPGPSGAGS